MRRWGEPPTPPKAEELEELPSSSPIWVDGRGRHGGQAPALRTDECPDRAGGGPLAHPGRTPAEPTPALFPRIGGRPAALCAAGD